MSLTFFFHLLILLLAAIIAGVRYRILSRADRFIALLLIATLLAEATAKVFALVYENNLIVYQIFTPLQFMLIALYFRHVHSGTWIGRLSLIAGSAGIALGIFTYFYIPPDRFDTYVLLTEGLCIIFLSLFTVTHLFRQESVHLLRHPVFWVSMILAAFWIVATIWYNTYNQIVDMGLFRYAYFTFVGMNYLHYSGLALLLLLYPKLHSDDI